MLHKKICALEDCNVIFETTTKRIYCCDAHTKIANRKQILKRNRKIDPEKKRLENMPSQRLAGKLVDCECPICHEKHQQRNVREAREGLAPIFCDSCRRVVEADYSDGHGTKYDYKTDKIEDFL